MERALNILYYTGAIVVYVQAISYKESGDYPTELWAYSRLFQGQEDVADNP